MVRLFLCWGAPGSALGGHRGQGGPMGARFVRLANPGGALRCATGFHWPMVPTLRGVGNLAQLLAALHDGTTGTSGAWRTGTLALAPCTGTSGAWRTGTSAGITGISSPPAS